MKKRCQSSEYLIVLALLLPAIIFMAAEAGAALSKLKFGDSRTWPVLPEQLYKKSMSHTVNVAVMTYVSEMFAWYAGSLEADTYFCPERHGMYFDGFGMKTAPAMGKKDCLIGTSLTGDSGRDFLTTLKDNPKPDFFKTITPGNGATRYSSSSIPTGFRVRLADGRNPGT